MAIIIVVLHVFVCLFLIAVILLQAGRGQGLSWGAFGSSPQSILGTKSASFLTKVTTVCASLFLITCIALNIIETRKSRSLFAPSKAGSQIDLAKIKQAIEEAQKKAPEAATVAQTASVPSVESTVKEIPTQPAVPAPSAELPVSAPVLPQDSNS
jgi:preprotein translocase subunit SecG